MTTTLNIGDLHSLGLWLRERGGFGRLSPEDAYRLQKCRVRLEAEAQELESYQKKAKAKVRRQTAEMIYDLVSGNRRGMP